MRQDRPSPSAYRVAIMRAAHQLLDHPKVFEDPMALRIVGARGEAEIRAAGRMLGTRLHRYLRAIVVARSRFAEDELARAVSRGVRQYVVLGAGLDTFAYRNPHACDTLRVFEVDHPATQEWKRRQLQAAKIAIPATVTHTAVDFESQTLAEQLQAAGFRTDEPAFFSWLGVTMYLTREAMMATIKYVASSTPSGSEIVFDYVVPPASQNVLRRLAFGLLARKMARLGEPWINFLDPAALTTDLRAIGFTRVEDLGPAEINRRFFSGRADGLMVGGLGRLMKAQH